MGRKKRRDTGMTFTIERQRKGSESRDFTFSWTRKPPRFQPVHENPTVPFTAHCRSLTYGGNFMVSPASRESSGNIGYGDRAYTPIPFLEHELPMLEFDEEHTSSRDAEPREKWPGNERTRRIRSSTRSN